ncbi:hypothetical protein [Paraburkholderia caballeronis]|uniref:Uncharacterized protein n=1 Tax=Paraburkholderia caballeronis TaxID=416943 RepID=A0A1H7L1B2_9BURK|nr:hypothetical protein [Paraburkholderia caballeronis]PXW28254.1 hypothetical protein C7403_102146 [Paraburkholderia caballeronis]PXX03620.1 hypothetical protein C7407_102146 [Paraburkholderia caballeronis]RAK04364.1 hypothetical protein C7409_102146 [Paraburkholderia caballeronis]SED83151.1 hypothetical protein SAMN05445871_4033 [Paraburkholderia caballeronis]SEK92843.1 hypothetical protein SAMN05192542_104146 [Paraburkholderia caballeronis]
MNFIAYDPLLGAVKLTDVDAVGPGPLNLVAGTGAGRQSFSFETLRGYDPVLGGGEFVFAKASTAIAAGTVVQFNQSLSGGSIVNSAAAWAGTANTGEPLGVAVAQLALGQWGWFQVGGNAIATVSGAPVAGNPVYWQAAGVVSPAAVAGKQALGAKFATAPGVTLGTGSTAVTLSATQAVITLNRTTSQGAIT